MQLCNRKEVALITDKITYDNMTLQSTVRINNEDINIDVKKLKRALNYCCDLRSKLSNDKFSDLYSLIECIDIAVEKSDLTEKQKERLVLWMNGYTEKEIAYKLNLSQVSVHNSLVQSVNLVAKTLKGVCKEWF